MKKVKLFMVSILGLIMAVVPVAAQALEAPTDNCQFKTTGNKMKLLGDCTTNHTIMIPDGLTLDGQRYTITARDPIDGHFLGAVVKNAGASASVVKLGINADNLANVCDDGDNRLRGIMFDGASGKISDNHIKAVNQGQSGCQEGNGIEVRNAPFDGSHPATKDIVIEDNVVEKYMKTGILANGDVDANIHHNTVRSANLASHLAANSIQMGFGATGRLHHNNIEGNQWSGAANTTATAVLLYEVRNVKVHHNTIKGNSDIGLDLSDSYNVEVHHNTVRDEGADINAHGYDYGISNYYSGTPNGPANTFHHNTVRGFDTPYYNVTGHHNNPPTPQS